VAWRLVRRDGAVPSPLGLPIPHTAIIPTRKDALGQSLGAFVGEHFLSAEVVRARLDSARWARGPEPALSDPANAERVTSEAAVVVRAGWPCCATRTWAIVEQVVARRLADLHVGAALGRVLGQVVTTAPTPGWSTRWPAACTGGWP